MDFLQIFGFMLVALLLVASPGPNGLLIAKTAANAGKKAAFVNIVGFIAAFYLHGVFSILGISVLLMQSANAFFIVKLIGAAYLAWIGVKSLIAAFKSNIVVMKEEGQFTVSQSTAKSFTEGMLTCGLNPKVSMFYLAAFPQFIPVSEHAMAYAFLLVSLHALINAFWFSAMIILLSRLRVAATKRLGFQRMLKGVTGAVFMGFGAKLLLLEGSVVKN